MEINRISQIEVWYMYVFIDTAFGFWFQVKSAQDQHFQLANILCQQIYFASLYVSKLWCACFSVQKYIIHVYFKLNGRVQGENEYKSSHQNLSRKL